MFGIIKLLSAMKTKDYTSLIGSKQKTEGLFYLVISIFSSFSENGRKGRESEMAIGGGRERERLSKNGRAY